MLNRLRVHRGCHVHATDGYIGIVEDFYFDDMRWELRYLVVNVGKFPLGRKVLISPVAITAFDPAAQVVSLKHTVTEIKNSPEIDVDKPVYRQLEEQLVNYYSWVTHWVPQADLPAPDSRPAPTGDTHLRSLNNVCKYTVMAFDGRVGSIADFVLESNDWHIPLVILDTANFLLANKVVLPSSHFKGIRVEDREISIDLYKGDVAKAPRLDPAQPLEEYLKLAA